MPVYLIRAGETGSYCKIGKADDPVARMREFQTAHYETLVLAKVWPGSHVEEDAMHRAFSEFHHRGEWFRFTPAMLDADPALLSGRKSRARRNPVKIHPLAHVFARAGGPSKLGKAVNRNHSTVLAWRRVPAEHVETVAKLTGLPRHELNGCWAVEPIAQALPDSEERPDQAAA